jgi:hypothetical protein
MVWNKEMLYKFDLEHIIRKPRENQEQLKMNGFWSVLMMLIYCTKNKKKKSY